MVKRLLMWFMRRREDEELRDEIVDYLSEWSREKVEAEEEPPEFLEERQEELVEKMNALREEIAEGFLKRSRLYLAIIFLFLVIYLLFVGCYNYISLPQFGALVGLVGSLILGYTLIQDTCKLYGILAATGYGSPRQYLKRSLINDTADGIWGVSYLIMGFSIQLFGNNIPVLYRILV